jgi:Alpha/beta hydrolase domain
MHAQMAKLSAFLLGAVPVLSVVSPSPARAEITGLTVQSAKDIGPFQGKPYREVEAQLKGTAPGGGYSVPVTLAFPKQASDHNGFAIVDVFNTVTVGDKKWFPGGRAFPVARFQMSEDFLFGTGHAYVGVIWDKKAVEALHNGTIATGTDGYTILSDTAALARNPSKYLPAEAGTAPASGRTIAYGYSQSSMVLRSWYLEHRNKQTGAPIFDGALIAGAAGRCWDLQKLGPKPCAGGLADGGKVIALATESDAQWGADTERGDNPDYRTVEIAGVSHIPVFLGDFRPYTRRRTQ